MSSQEPNHLRILNGERILAITLSLAWVVIAFRISGFPLAVRAAIFFMIPLTMIVLPGPLSHLPPITRRGISHQPCHPSPSTIRFFGWLTLLGIPAAWKVLFSL